MFLPRSTRLFCTSRFYVLAKTLAALLEIPFKKDIYQLEEDPNLQHFDGEFERVPGDLILYGLNSFSIVCPGIFFQCFLKVKNVTQLSVCHFCRIQGLPIFYARVVSMFTFKESPVSPLESGESWGTWPWGIQLYLL